MYLYTDVIEFAPFGSRENRRSRSAEIVTLSDDKVPRPSPKSIYRLADKVRDGAFATFAEFPTSDKFPLQYNVPALKTLALNQIRSELEKCDIVEESFSRFASRRVAPTTHGGYMLTRRLRYIEIRRLCIDRLDSVWMEDSTTETTRASVDKKIDGDLGHAMEMLTALWEIANGCEVAKTPSSASPAVSSPVLSHDQRNQAGGARRKGNNKGENATAAPRQTTPAHWATVKIALVKSIRNGVFFDRKYWARDYKTGDILKPVYFLKHNHGR
jgi:hypothetical protein